MMPHTVIGMSFMRRFFWKITLRRRKNFAEMHFKPANQAAMTELCIGKTNRFRQDGIESRIIEDEKYNGKIVTVK